MSPGSGPGLECPGAIGRPMPDQPRAELSAEARSIAATNLAIAAECRDLLADFERSGIPLLFIKGLTVGALAYRAPLLKMGWDIDLLIDPGRPAVGVRTAPGTRLCGAPAAQRRGTSIMAYAKQGIRLVPSGSFYIELHTRLADNRRMIPGVDVHSAAAIGGDQARRYATDPGRGRTVRLPRRPRRIERLVPAQVDFGLRGFNPRAIAPPRSNAFIAARKSLAPPARRGRPCCSRTSFRCAASRPDIAASALAPDPINPTAVQCCPAHHDRRNG